MTAPLPAPIALQLHHVSKVFQGQWALDGVDLELRAGEVHALLGPNGSGKSTLIKILAGYHGAEAGAEAKIFGKPFQLGSQMQEHPIRFIHQDLGLVGELDTVDNLALGGGYSSKWWLSGRAERRYAKAKLAALGLSIDVAAPVGSLSKAVQTMLAVVRAVDGIGGQGLLVLDEPTVSLPPREVEVLFDLVREFKRQGGTVLYVTHRLGEVFDIADRVTVLRDGKRVGTLGVDELNHDGLVELIVGRELLAMSNDDNPPVDPAMVRLSVGALAGAGVHGIDLTACKGEIVGITGLVGSGYEDVLRIIFNASERVAGEIDVNGVALVDGGPHESIAAGVAYAPSDRSRLSAISGWTLRENVTLPDLRPRRLLRWLSDSHESADARVWLDRLNVVPSDPNRPFASLSGGNQQKVVLARWLRCGAHIFLLEEPTNGVDVGAKRAIYEAVREVATQGSAVLMTSQDIEELTGICDRVLVLRHGRVGAVLYGPQLTAERIVIESVRIDTAPETRVSVS